MKANIRNRYEGRNVRSRINENLALISSNRNDMMIAGMYASIITPKLDIPDRSRVPVIGEVKVRFPAFNPFVSRKVFKSNNAPTIGSRIKLYPLFVLKMRSKLN